MRVLQKITPILFLGLVGRKTFLTVATDTATACSSLPKSHWLQHSFKMSSAATTSTYTPGDSSICYVTTPNEESAKKLARDLVTLKLAACVNILPNIQSIYQWEGKINEDLELLLMIKTNTELVEELSTYVRENHPYSVAEVISVKIENGNPPYLDWITKTVKKPNEKNKS
ncbi:protein CutA homolog [Contarinia nasturtii]|uniref:protein CutA homolog n=1 Tax=Contarinia nasturtii TaxID=265458 RepID=UPI0012D454CC|nr:protein CutA homolog [Contarinia nasturtii]